MKVYEVAKEVAKLAATSDNADLIRAANDAMIQVAELVAENFEVRARVRELEEALRFNGDLKLERNVLWAEGDAVPYCRVCWERDKKALHLSSSLKYAAHYCQNCHNAWLTAEGEAPPPLTLKILHGKFEK